MHVNIQQVENAQSKIFATFYTQTTVSKCITNKGTQTNKYEYTFKNHKLLNKSKMLATNILQQQADTKNQTHQ